MNKLSIQKQAAIIHQLCEGSSINSTVRITGASKNTILSLLQKVGRACQVFHDQQVRNVKCKYIQADETWSFVYSKQKNVPEHKKGEAGDVWTWTAIDADTKLIVSYLVGSRDSEAARLFVEDIAQRLANKVQITTDGHKPYINAIENQFDLGDVDYAQLIKIYDNDDKGEKRYSPAKFREAKKERIMGQPREGKVSTSYVERQNLSQRMHMRRFTRLTNGFSKKMENHCYAVALHTIYQNFCKVHGTIKTTPAIKAGITNELMTVEDIVNLVN